MTLYLDDHTYRYELENLCRALFAPEEVRVEEGAPPQGENYIYAGAGEAGEEMELTVAASLGGDFVRREERLRPDPREGTGQCEHALGRMLYRIVGESTGRQLPWGILTGVRPAKLIERYETLGYTEPEIQRAFTQDLFVAPEKYELCRDTSYREREIIALSGPKSYSLYVSIPFCPTRCRYCSFVSQATDRERGLIPAYVEALEEEIALTGEIAAGLGLKLETVYFGGGTPTTLSAEQLGRLLDRVERCFDLGGLREFTVEAGRPDTITAEKLAALKAGPVSRISINPQALTDEVLRTIGRGHTVEQFFKSFALARKMGFDNINTDVIAGLEGDSLSGFQDTIDGLIGLGAENITVHTLSIKRSSTLRQDRGEAPLPGESQAAQMVRYAAGRLREEGYLPYYLYRQKNMLDNLENVGYTRPGFDGLYNVYIMDETHSILAVGAGASTKLRQPGGSRIERVFNYKYPLDYLKSFEEMKKRKWQVRDFYERYMV